jgi:type II secretory pathway component PulJ
MISQLRRDDRGVSLMEVNMALFISSLVMAALVTVFMSFSQNTSDSGRQAELQQAARSVVATMATELREAAVASVNGDPIQSLDAAHITFFTTKTAAVGLEKVTYERINCSLGRCELWVTRYASIAGTGPEWQFQATPLDRRMLMSRILDDEATFSGVLWTGTPRMKTLVGSCTGATGSRCSFRTVSIQLRVEPTGTSRGATRAFELVEEASVRNA